MKPPQALDIMARDLSLPEDSLQVAGGFKAGQLLITEKAQPAGALANHGMVGSHAWNDAVVRAKAERLFNTLGVKTPVQTLALATDEIIEATDTGRQLRQPRHHP